MRAFLVAALVLSACASAPRVEAPSAAPVIAAERAFAADAAVRGWAAAFRRAAAPDAITLSPDPVNAQENLARFEGDGETNLAWGPIYAGISSDGGFGFTTGPFWSRDREGIIGHYFTVWRRQSDGSWKWIFDAGTDVRDPGLAVASNGAIPTLTVAAFGAGSAEVAKTQVASIEAQIGSGAEAVVPFLVQDVRVNRPGAAPGVGFRDSAELVRADGEIAFHASHREASAAGDMVFSYGTTWDFVEGAERMRYYARIWQRRPEGWRIVFEEIVPRRGG